MPLVNYSLATTLEIDQWVTSLTTTLHISPELKQKHPKPTITTDSDTDDDSISSSEQKISRKDHYFMSTILKIHEKKRIRSLGLTD
jgi:hypothetical protein